MSKDSDMEDIIAKLSPIERNILPYISEGLESVKKTTNIDEVSILRAVDFLENKGIVRKKVKISHIVDLGVNGVYYKKNHLPERRLLTAVMENKPMTLEEAQKHSKLTDNEFKAALGVLRKKVFIDLVKGKIMLQASKEEATKKTMEEKFIESLPKEKSALSPEETFCLNNLSSRKDIVEIKEKKDISVELTDLGKRVSSSKLDLDFIEEVNMDIIKSYDGKKKFRKYDINAQVPKLFGGKKHFVNQAQEYARGIWKDMGFREMSGPMVDTSFWMFDALFTPQDHPAREMQDTFFIKDIKGELPDKKIVDRIRLSHEKGVDKSKGWNYEWKEDPAQKLVLRTHTTGVSARTLVNLDKSKLPAKYFALGKCFRNESLDWSHGFEFNQTEGIVIDKNANFRHLLGYLREFFKKMGYEKIRFNPCYYPYTEPSVEISVWHPERKVWFELGGAGIFRPEVVIPLLGEYIPVLAWGPGFDRTLMEYYNIKDLRELYANDIKSLRNKGVMTK